MGKSSHFIGQPQKQGRCLDEASADNRFRYHRTVLRPPVQGVGRTASHDSFMLKPSALSKGDIIAMDRRISTLSQVNKLVAFVRLVPVRQNDDRQ